MKFKTNKTRYISTFILSYLIGVGLLDISLRYILGTAIDNTFLLFYVNTLKYALFFGLILIILNVLKPENRLRSHIINLSKSFWIVALHPLFSSLVNQEVTGYIVSTDHIGLLLLIFIISLIMAISSFTKLTRNAISFCLIIASYFPVFYINRIALNIKPEASFELYQILSVDVFGEDKVILISNQYYLIAVLLIIEISLVYLLLARISFGKTFKELINIIRPFRTLHFVMMVILGVIFVRTVTPEEALSLTSINHFPFVFIPALCLALVWQFTTLLNDLYDQDIDEKVHPDRPLISGALKRYHHIDLLITTGLLSSLFSLFLGAPIFLLNLAAISLAVIYSIPPLRLRDRMFGSICVGLGSVVGFLAGVYSPPSWHVKNFISSIWIKREISFYPEILLACFLITVVLSISPLINALPDYEGDLKAGVNNIYTVLGFQKGKKLVTILIIFLFLAPIVFLSTILDFIILLLPGIIASIIFYRLEDHRPVFGLYFLVLSYLILRFLSMI